MQEQTVGQVLAGVVVNSFARFYAYLPQFVGGLLILFFGIIAAAVVKKAVLGFFRVLDLQKWLRKIKIADKKTIDIWTELIAELFRWSTVILFLVPAVEAWGIPRVTNVLNQLLFYIPNVFVAVVVGFVGFIVAGLTFDVVYHGSEGLGSNQAKALATFARYAILFFTGLIVLNQLGVASQLIRILFTGIVAMLAIAGGLAFGLGGQDLARDILKGLREKLEK